MQIYEEINNDIFYHGTSSTRMSGIGKTGLTDPDLTTDYEKAEYYAEEAVEEFGGDIVILQINKLNKNNLRVNFPELEEPVSTSEYSIDELENMVQVEYEKYIEQYPKSYDKNTDIISVDPKHYWVSMNATTTVKYDGIIPVTDIEEV